MTNNKRALTIGIIVVVVLFALCTVCICGGAALIYYVGSQEIGVDPTIAPPPTTDIIEITTPTPTAEADNPTGADVDVTEAKQQELAEQTVSTLQQAEIPNSDLHELAIRYLDVPSDTPRTIENRGEYEVGDRRVFTVSDLDNDESFDITAELYYKTAHVYMWVEEGVNVDGDAIQESADLFEEHTYPTNREFFGSEWTPGVDNDPHLSILHAENLGSTVAGYFSSADSFVKAVRSDSNETEMFYIHVSWGVQPGDAFYNGVLAHEFQHMIHWYNDRNEDTWLNEGLSELAMELNNRSYTTEPGTYDVGGSEISYLQKTDTQLNNWPEADDVGDAGPNYGAGYLFTSYFLERFGEKATRALVAHPDNGMDSVDAVMQDVVGLDSNHVDLFADWTIANLLDAPDLGDGRFGYSRISIGTPRPAKRYNTTSSLPDGPVEATVHQYGVDYIEINLDQPLTFTFEGNDFIGLLDAKPYSGDHIWWSNRQDESDTRLTRVIDLSEATTAELAYQTWYHIEKDWDYAYVAVGTTPSGTIPDDISSTEIDWEIMSDNGIRCTRNNPNNSNLSCGITGEADSWSERTLDLTRYAGQEIAIRFEYITDAAVNQAGLALDDITLTIDGAVVFTDDAETESTDWIAEGFVRIANIVPQEWVVQLVTYNDTIKVDQLVMPGMPGEEWTIDLDENTDRAVIVISAVAPFTSEVATYTYSLELQ